MKKRWVAVAMTIVGLTITSAPAVAISGAGCEGLKKAGGFVTVDLRGDSLDQLFAQLNEAIPGDEGPPQTAIFVPRNQLVNDCKLPI